MVEVFEEDVNRHDSCCAKDGFGEHSKADKTTNRRGTPYRGCRREALDRVAILEDNTGTEETDTGYHLRDNTAVIATRYTRRHKHIKRTTDSDERNRTRTHHFTMQLALHTNEITQCRRQHNLGYNRQPVRLKKRIYHKFICFTLQNY